MRAGDKPGAANLINTVRKRYFPEGDPDPVTASNLDKYRMLDEWMMEFLGGGPSPYGLGTLGCFTSPRTGGVDQATNNQNLNRFPDPLRLDRSR